MIPPPRMTTFLSFAGASAADAAAVATIAGEGLWRVARGEVRRGTPAAVAEAVGRMPRHAIARAWCIGLVVVNCR